MLQELQSLGDSCKLASVCCKRGKSRFLQIILGVWLEPGWQFVSGGPRETVNCASARFALVLNSETDPCSEIPVVTLLVQLDSCEILSPVRF